MYARLSYCSGPPQQVDAMISNWRDNVLPAVTQQMKEAGVKDHGAMVLVDRSLGKSISISFWETEDDLRASEQLAERARGKRLMPWVGMSPASSGTRWFRPGVRPRFTSHPRGCPPSVTGRAALNWPRHGQLDHDAIEPAESDVGSSCPHL